MLDLRQLRMLTAVYEHGSLSAAAEALHVSQPALSRSMQQLEAELGVTLFDRRRNRLVFRELGVRAVDGARRLLLDADAYLQDLHDYAERLSIVRIGSSSPAPLWRLSTLIHERFPNVVIAEEQRSAEELLDGLRSGHYRLILSHNPVREEGILCRRFLEERLMLELPAEHPLCALKAVEEKDLTGVTVLAYRNIGIWRERFSRLEGLHRIEQSELDVLEDLALSSGLPLLVTSLRASPTMGIGGRVLLPILGETTRMTFYLCGHERDRPLFERII